MISQIGNVSTAPQAGSPRPTAANGTASTFGDLVQQIIVERVAAKPAPVSVAKAVPHLQSGPVPEQPAIANNVPAPVGKVAAPSPLDPFSAAQSVADPKKADSKTAAVVQDAVQVSEAALAVPVKMLETPASPVSSGPARVTRKADTAKSTQAAAPVVTVVIGDLVLAKPVKTPVGDKDARPAPVPVTAEAAEAPPTLSAPAAVQVRIRAQDAESAAPTAPVVAIASNKLAPVQVVPTELPIAPALVATAQVAQTVATPVVTPLQVQPQPVAAKAAPVPSPGAQMDEPISEQPKTQPLKSVSIDFTPDGGQDVRLRLSEHAGDVHISLHTTDPSLSGRLNDGVKDLVDSLTTAGYDAQAWTPDQGRQNQRQAEEPRRTRNQGSGDPGAETFDDTMQQPNIQEIS